MSYCSHCGAKIAGDGKFCASCGKKSDHHKESVTKNEHHSGEPNRSGSKTGWAIVVIIVLVCLIIGGMFSLAFLGAKGQPGTIVKPSTVKTPLNLQAQGVDNAIGIKWDKSGSSDVTKYNIYKSQTSAANFAKIHTLETISNLNYADSQVQKGITYYYVVTSVSAAGVESGNSNQVSYALTPPPLLPNGVQNWSDVLTKYDADKKYADVFGQVTGLTRADIEKFIAQEAKGKILTKKLAKGTVITNTTENYVVLKNYTLPEDKWFLTDDKGVPRIMIYCGNPIKLISEMTAFAKMVQTVQHITYNIIYVLPAPVINLVIYASAPVSQVFVSIAPDAYGPGMLPEDTEITEEPLITTTASPTPTSSPTTTLQAGQQWAVEGKILLEANPVDPAPEQSVTMTVTLIPVAAGITINYEVSGTDGYSDSGSAQSDNEGKITFTIPGGGENVVDTIKVSVPDKNLSGSTSYTF